MERYLVFAGYYYYPSGGIDDLVCTTDNCDLFHIAKLAGQISHRFDWLHVWDSKECAIVIEHTSGRSDPDNGKFNLKKIMENTNDTI